MARFHDRSGSPLVLGMTHEEAAVHLVRDYGQNYTKYPFMIYQIQTRACLKNAFPGMCVTLCGMQDPIGEA